MTQVKTRQSRRLERLADEGISQVNLLVHASWRSYIDELRPHLNNVGSSDLIEQLSKSLPPAKPVNVAQVRQLSPFRYPGGKTWLVPIARRWIQELEKKPNLFLEPFAGGAMVGLTIAAEGLADQVKLIELDEEVSAVWNCIFNGSDNDFKRFTNLILEFKVTEDKVRTIILSKPRALHVKAFRTIVKNRCQRGGIMAPGAGLVKSGENGKGLMSRWYPETLVKRMNALRTLREIITFEQGDALEAISSNLDATMFIDPPYTAAGKRAGSRLYTHNILDHDRLFALVKSSNAQAMLTYDDNQEVRTMAADHGFVTDDVLMKSGHHKIMRELILLKR